MGRNGESKAERVEYDEEQFLDYIALAHCLFEDKQKKLAKEFLRRALDIYSGWDFNSLFTIKLREDLREVYLFGAE